MLMKHRSIKLFNVWLQAQIISLDKPVLFLQILIIFYNRAQVATAIDAEFEDMEIQYGIQNL